MQQSHEPGEKPQAAPVETAREVRQGETKGNMPIVLLVSAIGAAILLLIILLFFW